MKRTILSVVSVCYVALMPYLIIKIVYEFFKEIENTTNSFNETDNMTGGFFAKYIIMIVLVCGVGVLACVVYNISSLTVLNERLSAALICVVRLCHLPTHALMILIFMGFLNPFLLIVSWLPLAVSFGWIMYSNCMNIGACIALWRRKRCRLKYCVIIFISGFVLIADFIGWVYQAYSAFESDEVKKWKGPYGVKN